MSGRREATHNVALSKRLSYLLRHGADKAGVEMDEEGWINVSDVLQWKDVRKLGATLADIEEVVRDNDKQRFALKRDGPDVFIRANQGHSIEVKVELERVLDASEYPTVIHGTNMDAWGKIKSSGGLDKMGRTHIHMAIGEYGAGEVISGMRKNCQVYIYLDLAKALADNIPFFLSANKVMLTAGVNGVLSSAYFQRVVRMPSYAELEFEPAAPTPLAPGSAEAEAAAAAPADEDEAPRAEAPRGARAAGGRDRGGRGRSGDRGGRSRGSGGRGGPAAAAAEDTSGVAFVAAGDDFPALGPGKKK